MARGAPYDRRGGVFGRIGRWFQTGPFSWMANSLPRRRRFHAGEHMHGLEQRDLEEGEPGFRGTGAREMPKTPSREPPAR